jgi:hypothetical protein
MPEIGDADGGALLPLCRREPADFAGMFAAAAMLFARGDYAWAADGPAAEVAWLGGRAGWRRWRGLRVAPPARPASALCLVDPVTGCHGAQPEWREFFRSRGTHSTVIIDGESQAEPDGLFSWGSHPGPARSSDEVDHVDADHDACTRLVTHRRRVLLVKSRYWILVDDVEGDGEHLVQLLFHFAPLPVSLRGDRWVQAHGPDGRGLFLRTFSNLMVEASITAGGGSGQRQPAPVLVHTTATTLPLRLVTLLVPQSEGGEPPQAFPVISEEQGVVGLIFAAGRELVLIDDHAIRLSPGPVILQ